MLVVADAVSVVGRRLLVVLRVVGKIVVALSGAPKFLQSEERAYYGNARNKLAVAWAHGAASSWCFPKAAGCKSRPTACG